METAVRLFAPRRWCIVFLAVALPSSVAESGCPSPDRGGSAPPGRNLLAPPRSDGDPGRTGRGRCELPRARQVGLRARPGSTGTILRP